MNLLLARDKPEGVAPSLGLGERVMGSGSGAAPKLRVRECALGVEGPSVTGGVGTRVATFVAKGSGIVCRT